MSALLLLLLLLLLWFQLLESARFHQCPICSKRHFACNLRRLVVRDMLGCRHKSTTRANLDANQFRFVRRQAAPQDQDLLPAHNNAHRRTGIDGPPFERSSRDSTPRSEVSSSSLFVSVGTKPSVNRAITSLGSSCASCGFINFFLGSRTQWGTFVIVVAADAATARSTTTTRCNSC